ncbi:hypothetical protein KIN20_033463 [Parelaphostrongylus tenuis]|uniref:Uncharacterized protein n=1 Tax=Parelaphostrongylus tenuis TaxID=148309 RepID=A0AAD5WJ86_PARTN|nr:hypothetical protein KIN20_033463 [Parelaphostrongylus tenuis]
MCDQVDKYSTVKVDDGTSVEFNTFAEDPVLPDDVDREPTASRSSLENCDGPNNNRYLSNGESVPLEEGNSYYGKLISIDADSTPYPEDLIMIGSTVDIQEDKSPLLMEEEHTLSESYEQSGKNRESLTSPASQSGKTIVVMPEDVEAAGLSMQNLGELTEAQFSALIDIVERRQRSMESAESPASINQEQYDDQIASSSSNGDSLAIVITDDGSLKLTDATGHTFTFDGAQLDALRIDINNLTDENIQQIVQLAMPAINIGSRNFAKSKAEIQRRRHAHTLNHHTRLPRFVIKNGILNNSQSAGHRIQMRQSDRSSLRNASIRYVKNGKCKVQYDDGRFEWVGDDSVDLSESKSEHFDHSGYHASSLSRESESSSTHGSVTQIKRHRLADSSSAITPSPTKRRSLEQIPNFCCLVCDRKVYQKEPSYIVIRLPACDDCTKEKMIVLDERSRRDHDLPKET